jgi:hypothetical protein
MNILNPFKKKKQFNNVRVKLLKREHVIENYYEDGFFKKVYFTFVWGYEDCWLKLCCFGGTAFKIKCLEKDVAQLIMPVILNNMSEQETAEHCKEWECWDYYKEYYS